MYTMTCIERLDYKTAAHQYTKIENGIPVNYMGGGNVDGWLFCRTLPNVTKIKSKNAHAWEKFLADVAKRITYLAKFTNIFTMEVEIKDGHHEIYSAYVRRSGELGLPVITQIWKNELGLYVFVEGGDKK